MDPRPEVQQVLKRCFQGEPHVYHQRPGNGELKYPCIVYKLTGIPTRFASNGRYIERREYQLTVIDRDPDSKLREEVAKLRWCRFDRAFVSDNLYHFIFTIHY